MNALFTRGVLSKSFRQAAQNGLKFSHANDTVTTEFEGFRVTFLGTSSSRPTNKRNVTSALMSTWKRMYMIDCGEGTQHQLNKCSVHTTTKLDTILITHTHGDHIYGLPGFLCSILAGVSKNDRSKIKIFGPRGVKDFLRTSIGLSTTTSWLNDQIEISEFWWGPPSKTVTRFSTDGYFSQDKGISINPGGPTPFFEDEQTKVYVAPITHTVNCVGYLFHEKDKPGHLNVEKLQSLGIPPSPLYAAIKSGSPAGAKALPPGFSCSDFLLDTMIGRKVMILGDTMNPRNLLPTGSGCDLIVHESTFPSNEESEAKQCGHSTARMAANFATEALAKNLCLTHFSPKFQQEDADVLSLLNEAQAVFPGPVFAAEDFLNVDVLPKRVTK